ncbi:DNA-entry nuclease inhibitor [compost metagenome]
MQLKTWPHNELLISYSQLAIYNSEVESPYSNWSDSHINQGFAWREGAVSFSTLDDAMCEVSVSLERDIAADDRCIRAIVVPFRVSRLGVTISSIMSEAFTYEIPEGQYALVFQIFHLPADEQGDQAYRYSFSFVPHSSPEAMILKQDDELSPPHPLVMEAEAAE